jgi:hypothetical protein
MKNKQNIKSFFVHVLFATICFNLNVVQAQVHNGAELYIGDNSILHIDSGSFNFGSGTTSRTTSNYGVLSMGMAHPGSELVLSDLWMDMFKLAVPQPSSTSRTFWFYANK